MTVVRKLEAPHFYLLGEIRVRRGMRGKWRVGSTGEQTPGYRRDGDHISFIVLA